MTREQAVAALEVGLAVADELVDSGADLLVTGDMGIANTTPPRRSSPRSPERNRSG